MSLTTHSMNIQTQPASTASPTSQPTPTLSLPSPTPNPARVTVEVPTTTPLPFNPFDPTWIKLWEQVGPISYLGLLCVFIWLLTRLVETVKGK
jgi:hypothetical protein